MRKDYGFTQEELGKIIHADRFKIARIEKGERNIVQPDELRNLAMAFNLTTLEKREFFALGIEQGELHEDTLLSKQFASAKEQYSYLVSKIGNMQNPAVIADAVGDIIAFNQTIYNLFPFSDELLREIQTSRDDATARNLMRYVFDETFGFKDRLDRDQWERVIKYNVAVLRAISLRHRGDEDFKRIYRDLITLKKFELFPSFWNSSKEQEILENSDLAQMSNRRYSITYEAKGKKQVIEYCTETTTTVTDCGGLYLIVYIALNAETARLFIDLSQGNKSIELFKNYDAWYAKRVGNNLSATT